MNIVPFLPSGVIMRRGPGNESRFAIRDPTSGREVSVGADWQRAYARWLHMRRASIIVPNQIRVIWLIEEFAERHRPAGNKERRIFGKEVRLLVQRLRDLGDPLVDEFSEAHCQTFRESSGVGPVKTETLIRRVRQIWRWAVGEGLAHRECPWLAQTQEHTIRTELVELVVRYLPEGTLQAIHAMVVADPQNCEDARQARVSLSAAVRFAARDACRQMQRDGRPDLVPALRRCKLAWFLGTHALNPAGGGPAGADLLVGHARAERVRDLRATVRARQKNIS